MAREETVDVLRSDIIFLQRVMETAIAELEAAVADGDVKEDVTIDLDEAICIVKAYLR